jgi:hypothetical protein
MAAAQPDLIPAHQRQAAGEHASLLAKRELRYYVSDVRNHMWFAMSLLGLSGALIRVDFGAFRVPGRAAVMRGRRH